MFEHLRQNGYIGLGPTADASFLFSGSSSASGVAGSSLSSGAKNVLRSGKTLAKTSGKDPKSRLLVSEIGGMERNSTTSLDVAENASNDVVFGDTLAILIPVIAREQNLLMVRPEIVITVSFRISLG